MSQMFSENKHFYQKAVIIETGTSHHKIGSALINHIIHSTIKYVTRVSTLQCTIGIYAYF